jgi:predicted Zn-dependent protease
MRQLRSRSRNMRPLRRVRGFFREVQLGLAFRLYQEDRYEESADVLRRLLTRFPDDEIVANRLAAVEGQAAIRAAAERFQDGDVADAEHDLDGVIRRFPASPAGYLMRALILAARDSGEAALAARRAAELAPEDPVVLFRAAHAMHAAGSSTAALELLNRAERLAASAEARTALPLHDETMPFEEIRDKIEFSAEVDALKEALRQSW